MTNSTIKTWRERIGAGEDFPMHVPSCVERAMMNEIAELRAAPSVIRPLLTREDHAAALAEVTKLLHAEPGTPDGDRMLVLAVLVEAYENEHFPITAAPPGWKLVPTEPTEEMLDAPFLGAIVQHNMLAIARRGLARNYAAMLTAAPAPAAALCPAGSKQK